MAHVSEIQNEVNPYIVQTGGWFGFGPNASPEATKHLKATKTERAARMKKLADKKNEMKTLKKTLLAQTQTQKIQDENKALDASIKQIDQQIKVLKGQVTPQQNGPPLRQIKNGP